MVASRKVRFSLTAVLVTLASSIGIAAASASSSGVKTSDNYCGKQYCVTAIYSPIEQNINYTLSVLGSGPSTGWYSIGQGNKMANANMIIGWVNSDSSVTTSQRSANGHRQPLANQVTAATYSVDTVNTRLINDTILSLSWTFAQTTTPSNSMAHMWAYSTKTPSSSQSDATLAIHNSYDQFNLDMTKAYTTNSTSSSQASSATFSATSSLSSSSSSSSQSSSGLLLSSDNSSSSGNSSMSANIFLAHMIFMVLAWMLLAPFGALLARYGRTLFTWFPAHRVIQMGTLLFMIVGFALSVAGVSSEGGPHMSETHHRVGLVIMILVLVQIGLGYWAHSYRSKTGKRYVGMVHVPLGILLLGLGVWNTQSGFELWTVQPNFKVSYIIYGWSALVILLYIGGLFLIPREIRQVNRKSESQESLHLEKMQRRDIDGLLPVYDYNRYNQVNSSEASIHCNNYDESHSNRRM